MQETQKDWLSHDWVTSIEPMSDWRKQYEEAAEDEAKRCAQWSDPELREAIRRRGTGDYYVLWYEVAKRKPTPETCWLLYDVLMSDRPYLDKYHGAAALLRLLGCTEFEEVELSANWPVVPANLAKLRSILESKFGPPAPRHPSDIHPIGERKSAHESALSRFLRSFAGYWFRMM